MNSRHAIQPIIYIAVFPELIPVSYTHLDVYKRQIQQVAAINDKINGIVWGVPMLVLIIATGIFMTARTRFFQIRRAKHVSDETFFAIFKKKDVTKTKERKRCV